jgi:two-component system response regulator AtoC
VLSLNIPFKEKGLAKILVVDDDPDILELLRLSISDAGHEVHTAVTTDEAMRIISEIGADISFVDIMLQNGSGLDLLKKVRKLYPETTVIIMTGHQDMETAIEAMLGGAFDYFPKPIESSELIRIVERVLEEKKIEAIPFQQPRWYGSKILIGESKAMSGVYKMIGIASQSRATVLIHGETGTGKELIAKAIHRYSPQRDRPYVSVNCSALAETLLESELFGHEKGAFTGAIQRHRGKFEMANGGTIFLDEVGDIPPSVQVKLLRVLQEREFERVGGEETISVDVRVIAATNRDIPRLISEGKFREDLLYRLKVIIIDVPSLRERKEDIPLLVDYFIGKANSECHKHIKGVAPDVIDIFMRYDWRGNIRELENVISRAVLMARGNVLLKEHIPEIAPSPSTSLSHEDVIRPLDDVEKELIEKALGFTNWNKGKVCELLHISRPRLERKLKKYRIERVWSHSVNYSTNR